MTAAVILAGGKSRRFGRDKALFPVAGQPMIVWVASALRQVFDDIFVAGGDPPGFEKLGLRCFPDPIPDRGALGGLYNGLTHTDSAQIFLCACDMPFIVPETVKAVLENIGSEQVTLPVIGGKRQPLHAVYSRRILPLVEATLEMPDMYLPALLDQAKVRVVQEEAFAHISDYHYSFVSLNDPESLQRYRHLLERDKHQSQ